MFWIKTQKGVLCNLAVASDIRLQSPDVSEKYTVAAYFPGSNNIDYTVLHGGTKDECVQYIEQVFLALKHEQEKANGY